MGRPRQHDRHLPPRMHLRGTVWYWRGPADGRQTWIRLSDDWPEALRLYLEREGPQATGTTVGEAMTLYRRERLPTLAASTQRDYQAAEATLRPVFGSTRLSAVTAGNVAVYLARRSRPTSANREVAYLSSVFEHAMRAGWCDANPCRGVRRNPERPRSRAVSPAEVSALLPHCTPILRAYLDVRLLTGLRQGELLALRLSDLREDGIHVERPSKRGRPRIILWSPALRGAIEAVLDLRPRHRTFLWPGRRGQPWGLWGLRSAWRRAMRAYVEAGGEAFREHDLRSAVADAVSLEHAQGLLGHQSATTTARHYRRTPPKVEPAG